MNVMAAMPGNLFTANCANATSAVCAFLDPGIELDGIGTGQS